MAGKKLTDRIDDALRDVGSMSFYDLAMLLYPDRKSWRYQSNGGPPGCFMALSAALRRGGFSVSSRGRLAGPGNRIVRSRAGRAPSGKDD